MVPPVSAEATILSERADACLAGLDSADQAIARRVFLRLVSLRDGRADPPRREPLPALGAGDDPARVARVLRRFADARLLVIDGSEASGNQASGNQASGNQASGNQASGHEASGNEASGNQASGNQASGHEASGNQASGNARVELADGALIAAWPTLEGWVRSHGKAEQLRRQLEADAARWRQRSDQSSDQRSDQSNDQRTSDAGLLDRAQLAELAGWLTDDVRRDLGVSGVTDAFIAASEAAARRSWWPGKAYVGSALAILLMLMILATPIILLFIVVLTAGVIHRLG
jgi:hypothetical protein